MKIRIIVTQLIPFAKVCALIFLASVAFSAHAEYYTVYPAPACGNCYKTQHSASHKHRHHKTTHHHYHRNIGLFIYYPQPPCPCDDPLGSTFCNCCSEPVSDGWQPSNYVVFSPHPDTMRNREFRKNDDDFSDNEDYRTGDDDAQRNPDMQVD